MLATVASKHKDEGGADENSSTATPARQLILLLFVSTGGILCSLMPQYHPSGQTVKDTGMTTDSRLDLDFLACLPSPRLRTRARLFSYSGRFLLFLLLLHSSKRVTSPSWRWQPLISSSPPTTWFRPSGRSRSDLLTLAPLSQTRKLEDLTPCSSVLSQRGPYSRWPCPVFRLSKPLRCSSRSCSTSARASAASCSRARARAASSNDAPRWASATTRSRRA